MRNFSPALLALVLVTALATTVSAMSTEPSAARRAADPGHVDAVTQQLIRDSIPDDIFERLDGTTGYAVPAVEETILLDSFESPTWPDVALWPLVNDLYPEIDGDYHWWPRDCRSKQYDGAGLIQVKSLWAVGGGADGSQLACGANYPNGVTSSAIMELDFSAYTNASLIELVFDYWLNLRTETENGVAPDGLFINLITRNEEGEPLPITLDRPTSDFPERFFDAPRRIDLLYATEVWPPHREFFLGGQESVLIQFLMLSSKEQSTKMEGVFIDNVRLVVDPEGGTPPTPSTPGSPTATSTGATPTPSQTSEPTTVTPDTPETPETPDTETPTDTPSATDETPETPETPTDTPSATDETPGTPDTVTPTDETPGTPDTVTPTDETPTAETDTPTATATEPPGFSIYLPIAYLKAPIDFVWPEPTEDVNATPTDVATPIPTEEGPSLEVALVEQNDSGKSGSASLIQIGPDIDVSVEILPAMELDSHPAGIYQGTCDALGEVLHELEPVANGLSDTMLMGADLREMADGAHSVAVFLDEESSGELIACGEMLELPDGRPMPPSSCPEPLPQCPPGAPPPTSTPCPFPPCLPTPCPCEP